MYYSNGTPSATYSYDSGINGVGQLTTISNQVSTTNFTTFDAMGRVTASNQQTNGQTYAFGYTYDLAGELKTETYPSNRVVSTTYDTMGRPISLNGSYQNQSTGYVTNMKYWANGGINSMTRGNALVHAETYNNRLQLTGVTEKGNNGNLLTLGLTWGASATTNNGLLGTATATGGGISLTQTFGYDILNRLTSASEANAAQIWQQTYQYDQYGNMWMPPSTPSLPAPAIGPGAPTANVYNPLTNRNTNSGYDNAGNLNSFASQSASFDAENRLLTVGSETYFYDGVGQRVGKSGPSASIMYVYDAFGQLASEYNLSTNPPVPSCVTCYVAGDHLGSLRLVTDGSQNANVIARHDFAPFGQEIPAGVGGRTSVWGATDNVSQRFTSQVRDSEVALDFFNARYLSSGLGRFISADPANAGMDFTNPQSMNGYGYVLGNPLGLVDPSGMGIGSFFSGLWDTVFGTKPCSVQFCVVTASTAPIGTYAWWMGGGWLTLSGAPTGGGSSSSSGGGSGGPTFYATGLYLEPVSTPPNTTLHLPAANKACPSIPAHPSNYPPQALYDFGLNASNSLSDNLSPDLAKTIAYAALVGPGQPFDFKNQPFAGANPQYRAYGNFAFGIFGYSLGFSSTYIRWGAGVASYGNMLFHGRIPKPRWGTPITGSPYGDNPLEQNEIQSGYQWAQMHAAGKC